MQSVPSTISEILVKGQITIFSKTSCPYCVKAKEYFKSLGASYVSYEVDTLDFPSELIVEMRELSKGLKTFPNIFIGKSSVRGYLDMMELEKKGELKKILNDEGIMLNKLQQSVIVIHANLYETTQIYLQKIVNELALNQLS